MNWIVSQIGAREDYAVPRALLTIGRLHTLFTDIWCRFGSSVLARGPAAMRALAGRRHADLPDRSVVSFSAEFMAQRLYSALNGQSRTGHEVADEFLRIGDRFDRRVAGHIRSLENDVRPRLLFAYNTGCLRTILQARRLGITTMVDQIDPARTEQDIVEEERQRWPGWDARPGRLSDRYFDRLNAEWEAADRIVVNSDWSADALKQQGVPPSKIAVVPLAYETLSLPERPRPDYRNRPLVALWLGQVILRKGIQYVFEAARQLLDTPWRFDIVGPLGITPEAIQTAPANIRMLGPVTRASARDYYRSADLFLLPTLSDGFAITQIEAMAHGLPVAATPRCGRVVTHEQDGVIVPPADATSLANELRRLAAQPDDLARMSANALKTARQFTLRRLAQELSALETVALHESTPRPAPAVSLNRPTQVEPRGVNWTVSLIGARQDYAAPRALHRVGRLERFYTDAWCRAGSSILARGPRLARAFAGRYHGELPPGRIVDFTLSSLYYRTLKSLQRESRSGEEMSNEYLQTGDWFDRRVAGHLQRHPVESNSILFSYNTGCLRTLQSARRLGIRCVVDQIDPAQSEQKIIEAERQRWPGWEDSIGALSKQYFDRLAAEWETADRIVVNSAWSKQALIEQGVDEEKITIIPLAYELPPASVPPPRRYERRPLTALWFGQVILRKGIQYLLEAAQQLRDSPWRFEIIGPIGISRQAVASAPPNVRFAGPVTRNESSRFYRSADVFLLPTLSDGFAITQLEALAHGLPVIVTDRCGKVVTSGHDGIIIPAADSRALAQALADLSANPDTIAAMSARAPVTAAKFSLERMGRDFLELENVLANGKPPGSTCEKSRRFEAGAMADSAGEQPVIPRAGPDNS